LRRRRARAITRVMPMIVAELVAAPGAAAVADAGNAPAAGPSRPSTSCRRAAAAEVLGIHRAALRQKLRKYGLG
jgi:Bacterial regulatory protein, Fis family